MEKNQVNPSETSEKKANANKYLDPDYKGEPLNEKLADGPVENRGCTDCLCCLIFTSFVLAWFAIGFYGFSNGDPMLLTYPFDSNGNQCGKPSTVTTDYPYVFYRFPIPLGNLSHHRVCLKSCPNKNQYTTDCYCSTKTEFKSCVLPYSDVAESGIYASEVNNIYLQMEA